MRFGRILLPALVLSSLGLSQVPVAADPTGETGGGTAYYVDASSGSDEATGRSPAAAWRSLDRVNATTFAPGDRILLHAGQSWQGQLWPKGSGSPGLPIVLGRYGPGPKPAVHGAGLVSDAVRLFNQHDWEIRDLEVTNAAPLTGEPGTNLRDLRGILVGGDAGGRLDHFRIDSVDVHDVTGEVNWIGGDTSGNAPGITFRTGWDRSKNTGGIVFRGTVSDEANPGGPTVLDDITVENSTIRRTSFGGIIVKQHTGSNAGATHTGWGERTSGADPSFAPHTNVVIRNNYITQDGTAYGCNGIYLTDVRGGLIERNVVHRTGTSGIEMYYADSVVVQHNEVYETRQKAGGTDSNGIDPDNATTNIDVQYNFVHDNGDGILLCQCGRNFGDTRIRYNVIKSNARYQVYLHSLRGTTAYVYNNTIYNDRANHLIFAMGSNLLAEYHIWNNVLYSTRPQVSLTTSPTIDYESNVYGGAALAVPADDSHPRIGDPMFLGEVTGPYGTEETGPRLEAALPLRVASGSRAVGTGNLVPDNGGVDFAGRSVYGGLPDAGAFEYRTPPAQPWESVNGFVTDQSGAPVPDATVVLTLNGRRYQAVTGADGFYRLGGVSFGQNGSISAGRDGYDGATGTVDVRHGDTARHDLTMISR
jgi:Carboxypeptidase regulatory-like domain/Right handed beta helix region